MGQEIRKTFEVGKWVYRSCTDPDTKNLWYMPYQVRKITAQSVFVMPQPGSGDYQDIRLKRRSLEHHGYTVSSTRGMVFHVELPEDYKKTTLGYLWAEEPRAVFGLPPEYTQEMLTDKYREFVKKHHPDKGGNPETFRKGQEAYERLSNGISLADALGMILKETKESDSGVV